jgi:fused signal recognition particle receptor
MFDGLKDKLSNFREDAEEVAEENAEELDDPEAVDDEAVDDDSTPAGPSDEGPVDDESDEDEAVESEPDEAESDEADETADEESVEADAEVSEADEDAVVVGDGDDDEESKSTGFARKAKSLATGKFVIEEEDLEGPLRELEIALLSSDVEMGVARQILDSIREDLVGETRKFTESTGSVVEQALRDALFDVISVGQFDFDARVAEAEKPLVVIFTGVNGVGKTTSIAKVAHYLEERGFSTVLANGDTYRAGANQQIQEHADNLGLKCISHEQGGDPTAVVYDAVEYAQANDVDVVLGDTAGRLHTSDDLMSQLAKLNRVVEPDLTIFVDEAVAGQDAVNRAREFDGAAEIDGTILTMADADSQGGAAISVSHVTGKPILFLGTGQGYDDLQPFDPEELVGDLVSED